MIERYVSKVRKRIRNKKYITATKLIIDQLIDYLQHPGKMSPFSFPSEAVEGRWPINKPDDPELD